jgi:filamentous hemagglutinin family protein
MQPKRASFTQHAIAFAVAAAFQPQLLAQTMPSGGQVAAGQATISQSGPGFMQIDQASQKAILNWESFSIGSGGHVNFFQQQGPSSVALNRVLGNNPSQIFGNLTANGRVFLVNPSGILFGPGSSVNVGALVASTLSITDDDFMAGRYVFSNAGGAGSILNQGNLFSHSGYTALLAPRVTNEGFIFANLGSVALAAGDRVTLDMVGDNLIRVSVDQAALNAAVVNTGSIEAFGGNVLLSAQSANALLDTVLNTEGIVRAHGFSVVDGEVVLSGGARGTTALSGEISSSRGMTISGDNVVIAGGGGRNAFLAASQGQTIEASSLAITTADGNNVSLTSFGGGQTVNIIGGSLDVRAGGGSIDMSSFGGDQTIKVRDGDHISIKATSGDVFMSAFDGKQALEIEGNGRNALEIGNAGGLGSISIFSPTQQLSAGRDGESGSITLIGPDTDFKSVLVNAGGLEGGRSTQTISTSGTLKVAGGARPGGIPLINGLLQAGDGVQTVSAGRVEVHSGPGGAGNVAWISAVTGDQHVTVAGDIEVLAGPGGEAALQVSSSPQLPPRPGVQTVSARNVLVQGGQSGTNANAFLGGNAAGGQSISLTGDLTVVGAPGGRASVFSAGPQTIDAANIRVLAGPGNGANIGSGPEYRQTITARGDIEIAGGISSNASISAPGAGALQSISARNITLSNGIDSPGNSAGVILGAHQVIDASGNVTLTAHSGTGTSSGVRIGASGAGATDLSLTVDGNLLLTGGTTGTNGAGLGGAGSGPTSDNNIVVIAGGDVILDGAVGGAGARIGSSALTPMQEGGISVTARSIRFTGTKPAAIRTLGNVALNAAEISQAPNGLILANALTTSSSGATLLGGANNVSSFTGTAGGDLLLRNLSPFLTLGSVDAAGALGIDQAGSLLIQASDAPLVVRGGLVNVATGGDLRLVGGSADGARAVLSSGGNVDLTVGGTLRLDEGAGKFAAARIQTESRDGVITLSFPNLTSGGFYVNGVEGDTKDGKSGFFIVHKPARIGQDLLIDYQE